MPRSRYDNRIDENLYLVALPSIIPRAHRVASEGARRRNDLYRPLKRRPVRRELPVYKSRNGLTHIDRRRRSATEAIACNPRVSRGAVPRATAPTEGCTCARPCARTCAGGGRGCASVCGAASAQVSCAATRPGRGNTDEVVTTLARRSDPNNRRHAIARPAYRAVLLRRRAHHRRHLSDTASYEREDAIRLRS